MSVKIIVLSDGETWETLSDEIRVMEITDEAFDELCDGLEPNDLENEQIIRTTDIKEAI